MKYLRGW